MLKAALVSLLVIGLLGHSPPAMAGSNTVVNYLRHADRQFETEQQRLEIVQALRDMIAQPVGLLKRRRYSDYEGRPGMWSPPELVRRYFLPTTSVHHFSDAEFYRDLHRPPAPSVLRSQLRSVQKENIR